MGVKAPVFRAWYFDGQTANKHPAQVTPTAQGLVIRFKNGQQQQWPYTSIHLADTGRGKGPVRLERTTGDKKQPITEQLMIEEAAFLERVEAVAPASLGTFWSRPQHARARRLLLWVSVFIIPFLLYGVWSVAIPALADQVTENVPPEWEVKLGDTVFEQLFPKPPREPTEAEQALLTPITDRLLATVPDQPYPFRIYIHPSRQVNALALPGGIVVLFQGLVNRSASPEELAGVMAHEFQHVLQRHSTRGIIRQLASGTLLALMVGDANGVMNTVLRTAGELDSLRFSRSMENEADREGMKMMIAARIDPDGMVRIYRKLEEQEKEMLSFAAGEDGDVPEWMEYLSTHPAAADRVKLLETLSRNAGSEPEPLLPEQDWTVMHKNKKPKTTTQQPARPEQ